VPSQATKTCLSRHVAAGASPHHGVECHPRTKLSTVTKFFTYGGKKKLFGICFGVGLGLGLGLGPILIKTGNALKLLKKYLESIFEATNEVSNLEAWGEVFIPARWASGSLGSVANSSSGGK